MIRGLQSNIRAVERTDARFIRDLLNEPSIAAGWGASGVPISIHRVEHDLEGWLAREVQFQRPSALIIESTDGEAVGLILVEISERSNQSLATLSLAVTTTEQEKGYGADAMAALLDALFDEWGVHRVQVRVEAPNQRALAFYESLGFGSEAVCKRATYSGGEWTDQVILGMLDTDPRPFAQ